MAAEKEPLGGARDASRELSSNYSSVNKELRKAIDLHKGLNGASRDLTLLTAEAIQSFGQYNKGLNQATSLISKIGEIGKSRFKDIAANINISTGATVNLVDAIESTVASMSDSVMLSGNIEKSQKKVLDALLQDQNVRNKIAEAGKLEFENQSKYITQLEVSLDKRLEQLDLETEILENEKSIEKSLQREVESAKQLLKIATTDADKASMKLDLAQSTKKLRAQELVVYEKSLGLERTSNQLKSDSSTLQDALNRKYNSSEEASQKILENIKAAAKETVALTIQYKQFGDYATEIADANLKSGDVLRRYNQMVSQEGRKEFEKQYADRIKGQKNLSKISKEEYDLSFRKNTLENALSESSALREKINARIAAQGGIKTRLDEEELAIAAQIAEQSKAQIASLNESLDKLKVVEAYDRRISDELKKQTISKNAVNVITNKLQDSLGDEYDAVANIGKAIKDSMLSPLALVGALIGSAIEEFIKLGEASKQLMGSSKLNADQIKEAATFARELSLQYRDQGLRVENVLESFSALYSVYGTTIPASEKLIEKVSLLGKAFGVSAENAAGVVAQVQRSTGASAETAGNIAALGANFAKAAGVAPDVVMQDIASSSSEIATYFKGTPKDLFKTAVEARRLGLSIKEVAGISAKLLDFESSIENQMTASVLLGREINLDKARQLAMEGDIQAAAEETLKQVGTLSDFNRLNAVQKKAVADAAGLEVGELQKSLQAQEVLNNMTSAQRREYEEGLTALNAGNEMTAEKMLMDQKNQITQQKLADAVAKISDIFANILLPVLDPIFSALAGIARVIGAMGPAIKVVVLGLLAVKTVSLAVVGVTRLISFKRANQELGIMKTLFNSLKATGSKLWTGLLNISGFTAAKNAILGLSGLKKADTAINNLNSKSVVFNTGAVKGKQAADAALRAAAVGKLAVVRADTLNTNLNTNAQATNSAASSKLGKIVQGIKNLFKASSLAKKVDTSETIVNTGAQNANAIANTKAGGIITRLGNFIKSTTLYKKLDTFFTNLNTRSQTINAASNLKAGNVISKVGAFIKGTSLFKAADTAITNSNTLAQVRNTVANSKIGQILQNIGKALRITSLFKKVDTAETIVNAGAQAASVAPTAAAGTAAGSAALGWAALGASLALVGFSIAAIIMSISSLATAFKELNPDQIQGVKDVLTSLGTGILIFTGILAALVYTGVLPAATVGLLAFGASIALVGAGVLMAAFGMQLLVNAFKELPADDVSNLGIALLSLAAGLGAIALASVGFVVALPAITLMTVSLMLLAPVFETLSASVGSLSTQFASLIQTLSSLDGSALLLSASGFAALAGALGILYVASLGIYAILPAMTLLTGSLALLNPVLLGIGAGITFISNGIQSFSTSLISASASVTIIGSALANMVATIGAGQLATISLGLISLAAGFGILTVASTGLLLSLPAITLFTGALTFLVPLFSQLLISISSFGSKIQELITSISSLPAETLFGSAAGFVALAGALGVFALASTGLYLIIPAVGILTGVLAVLSPVLTGIGQGITLIATGFQNLATAVSQIDPATMWSIAAAFGGMALALGALALATYTVAAFAPAAILLGEVLLAVGASALMVGIGLQLASSAIESISSSLTNLVTNVSGDSLVSMSKGLVALAGGIGILALAAVGFSVAIIPLTIFTGLMGLLGTTLNLVGTGINSIVIGIDAFATTMNSLLPMVDQIGVLSDAFTDLAISIGEVGVASLLAFPAMAALGGVASLLGGLFGKEEAPTPTPAMSPAPMPTAGVGAIATSTATTAAGGTTATETATPGAATAIPDLSELMTKLDSLISSVNSQPIQLVVNGKVLAEVVGRNTSRTGAVGK